MHNFNDPSKFVLVRNVPVLDEHELTNEDGKPSGFVDAKILSQIAHNNNRRVKETGDPAPLIVGHTEDEPGAKERPVVGYAINYRVAPFKNGRQAIYADFAVRKKYAHVIDDYPRRSVELWLSRREIDPIALLGGSSPERDLGVIVRNSRSGQAVEQYARQLAFARGQMHFQAIALLGSTPPARDLGVVYRYSRNSGSVLNYAMQEDKVGKVMDEFKSGELHSGSKRGPKVTSRDQALAIAMSESGQSRPSKKGRGEDEMNPGTYGRDDMDDEPNEGDEGAEGLNGMGGGEEDASPHEFGGGEDMDMGEDSDPMVAKVLASKQFRDMQSKIDEMYEAIMGGGEAGAGAGGEMDGAGAQPDGMDMAGAGAGGVGGAGGGGMPPDEEAREFHEPPPVRFGKGDGMGGDEEACHYNAGGGYAGPSSVNVPTTSGGRRGSKPYSRNGQANGHNGGGSMNGQVQRRSRTPAQNANAQSRDSQEVIKLRRQVNELLVRNARAEAEKLVGQLKAEGILFGESPEDAHANEQYEISFMAALQPQDQKFHMQRIRKLYRRAERAPADGYGGYPGADGDLMFQMSRHGATGTPQVDDPNGFIAKNPQEAMEYANAISQQMSRGASRADAETAAVKYMRSRGRR